MNEYIFAFLFSFIFLEDWNGVVRESRGVAVYWRDAVIGFLLSQRSSSDEVSNLFFVSLDEYYDLYTNGFVYYNWNNKKRLVLLQWYVFDKICPLICFSWNMKWVIFNFSYSSRKWYFCLLRKKELVFVIVMICLW